MASFDDAKERLSGEQIADLFVGIADQVRVVQTSLAVATVVTHTSVVNADLPTEARNESHFLGEASATAAIGGDPLAQAESFVETEHTVATGKVIERAAFELERRWERRPNAGEAIPPPLVQTTTIAEAQ